MNKDDIKLCLYLAIGILLIIVAVKFFIKILPLIIIALIGLLIYDSYQRRKSNLPSTKKKDKKDKIKEAEIIREKNID